MLINFTLMYQAHCTITRVNLISFATISLIVHHYYHYMHVYQLHTSLDFFFRDNFNWLALQVAPAMPHASPCIMGNRLRHNLSGSLIGCLWSVGVAPARLLAMLTPGGGTTKSISHNVYHKTRVIGGLSGVTCSLVCVKGLRAFIIRGWHGQDEGMTG